MADSSDTRAACLLCRKRKRKCSRGHPCEYCLANNLDCEYAVNGNQVREIEKNLENLQRRTEDLEKMFFSQSLVLREVVPSLATQEVKKLENKYRAVASTDDEPDSTKPMQMPTPPPVTRNSESKPELKRQRLSSDTGSEASTAAWEHEICHYIRPETCFLPALDILKPLVVTYFAYVHPWIPMVHGRTFMEKFENGLTAEVDIVLHAIVVATAKFSTDPRLRNNKEARENLVKACRQKVILTSVESISIHNLQALIIITFDSISAGNGPRTWSLVDSMTRMVEHLQLSKEEENTNPQKEQLLHRMSFMAPATTWVEAEERRRIYWNVFFLDRFCSVSAGWEPTLPAPHMERRLPSDGEIFNNGAPPVVGRFFHAHGNEKYDVTSPENACLGGLAYAVEATESLRQVVKLHISADMNAHDPRSIQKWLDDFKKLDLQLVNWKLNLPPKWRNEQMTTLDAKGKKVMDQNLTLAHATHNTSVILLHQFIAYPPIDWLPQFVMQQQNASAKTCVSAAVQICHVTQLYLSHNEGITNPQFAFCLFIAGRVLLAHSNYNKVAIIPQLYDIIDCLLDISKRFQGSAAADTSTEQSLDIASNFAHDLSRWTTKSTLDAEGVDIRKPAYHNHESVAGKPLDRTPNSDALYMDFFRSLDSIPYTSKRSDELSYESKNFSADIESFFDTQKFLNLDRVWTSSDYSYS